MGGQVERFKKRKQFHPATRGRLRDALRSQPHMRRIAPESPRPDLILKTLLRSSKNTLTHDDEKIWDLLVSIAYQDDPSMSGGSSAVFMKEIIRFLGNRCRAADIERSIERLRNARLTFGVKQHGRYYQGVALVHGWHMSESEGGEDILEFELPRPILEMMRLREGYSYIELDAIRSMRSKYSLALYRLLVRWVGRRVWEPGKDNVLSFNFTPSHLAKEVGFPVDADGRPHVGKLRAKFLDRIASELAGVRAWTVGYEVDQGGGRSKTRRGRPVLDIKFTIQLTMPTLRKAPSVGFIPHKDLPSIGGMDAPRFQVSVRTWRRIAKAYDKKMGPSVKHLVSAWLVALQEALDEEPLTASYGTRRFRGQRLLAAIDDKTIGPEEAAWGFFSEEADCRDIIVDRRHSYDEIMAWHRRVTAADKKRRERIDWDAFRRRQRKAVRTRREKEEAENRASLASSAPVSNASPIPAPVPAPVRRPPPRPAFLSTKPNIEKIEAPKPAPAVTFVPHFDWEGCPTHVTIEGEYELVKGGLPPEIIAILPVDGRNGAVLPVKFDGKTIYYSKPKPPVPPVLRDAEGKPRKHPMFENCLRFDKLTLTEKQNEVSNFLLGRAPTHGTSEEEIAARPVGYGDLPEAQTPPPPGSYPKHPELPTEAPRERIDPRPPRPIGIRPWRQPPPAPIDDDCPF